MITLFDEFNKRVLEEEEREKIRTTQSNHWKTGNCNTELQLQKTGTHIIGSMALSEVCGVENLLGRNNISFRPVSIVH